MYDHEEEDFIENVFLKTFPKRIKVVFSGPDSRWLFRYADLKHIRDAIFCSKDGYFCLRDNPYESNVAIISTNNIGPLLPKCGLEPVEGTTFFVFSRPYWRFLREDIDEDEDDLKLYDRIVGFKFDLHQVFRFKSEDGHLIDIHMSKEELCFKENNTLSDYFTEEQLNWTPKPKCRSYVRSKKKERGH